MSSLNAEEITLVGPTTEPARGEVLPYSGQHSFGHIRIKGSLAQGSLSEVFLGENLLIQRPCAVKLFHANSGINAIRRGRYAHDVKQLALIDDSRLTQVYDVGQQPDGATYAVLDFVPGVDLHRLLAPNKKLPDAEAISVVRQVAAGLASAHAHNFHHLWLHPGNVMVFREREKLEVRILDFGVIHLHPIQVTEDATPADFHLAAFLAPEVRAGLRGDQRSDVFSLGAILYRCLTGMTPPALNNAETSPDGGRPATSRIPTELAQQRPALAEAIVTALDKDPRRRFATAEAFIAAAHPQPTALEQPAIRRRPTGNQRILAQTTTTEILDLLPAETATVPVVPTRRLLDRRALIAGAVATVATGGLAAAWLLRRSPESDRRRRTTRSRRSRTKRDD